MVGFSSLHSDSLWSSSGLFPKKSLQRELSLVIKNSILKTVSCFVWICEDSQRRLGQGLETCHHLEVAQRAAVS